MSEKENDTDNMTTDPPEDQGGGEVSGASLESSSSTTDAAPIDPPENQGGGN
jgi:hypothetical protein